MRPYAMSNKAQKWSVNLLDAAGVCAGAAGRLEQGKGRRTSERSIQSQTGPDLLDSDLIPALCVCRA